MINELKRIAEKLPKAEQQCLLEIAYQFKDGTRQQEKLKMCSERCKMVQEYTDYSLEEQCVVCPLNNI